tara:strand:- start:254 stop:1942 length:1689 start_codon:yes stop_codon:yes gene_type:complete
MKSLQSVISKLRFLFDRKDKLHFFSLFAYTVLYSVIEMVGVGIIIPFLNLVTQFEIVYTHAIFNTLYTSLGRPSPNTTIILMGLGLILFYISRAGISLHYAYTTSRFVQGRFHSIAHRLFNHYLQLPYLSYQAHHSGQLSRTIITESDQLSNLIYFSLVVLSESITTIFIYSFLLFINWKATLLISMYAGLVCIVLACIIRRKTNQAAAERERNHNQFYKTIHETFKNFKLIKCLSDMDYLKQHFHASSYGLSQANIKAKVIGQLPRGVLEASGIIIMLSFIVVSTIQHLNLDQIIPFISVYGLAFFRLMPAFNRLLQAYNQVLFLAPSLDCVYQSFTIQTEQLGNKSIEFKSMVHVDAVSFSYPNAPAPPILANHSLKIPYLSSIGIMGISGSGKSTLLDIICGIISPDSGHVCVDGIPLDFETIRNWRASIGYVTQETTLFDDTVGYNIAFGHAYNEARIIELLHAVKLYDFFNMHTGIHTPIGENGCRLSGGQRQRIGVARALYHQPQLLILDEATSALDKETEHHLINEVFSKLKSQTIISVSHHAAALHYCDQIIRL